MNKRTTFFESFVTVMKMKDIRTKSENTTPRQRAAARIPKEALHQLWLQGKEKSHVEIENEANAQQNGDYTEPAHTGEKIADALQSAGKSSAKVAIHKGHVFNTPIVITGVNTSPGKGRIRAGTLPVSLTM